MSSSDRFEGVTTGLETEGGGEHSPLRPWAPGSCVVAWTRSRGLADIVWNPFRTLAYEYPT